MVFSRFLAPVCLLGLVAGDANENKRQLWYDSRQYTNNTGMWTNTTTGPVTTTVAGSSGSTTTVAGSGSSVGTTTTASSGGTTTTVAAEASTGGTVATFNSSALIINMSLSMDNPFNSSQWLQQPVKDQFRKDFAAGCTTAIRVVLKAAGCDGVTFPSRRTIRRSLQSSSLKINYAVRYPKGTSDTLAKSLKDAGGTTTFKTDLGAGLKAAMIASKGNYPAGVDVMKAADAAEKSAKAATIQVATAATSSALTTSSANALTVGVLAFVSAFALFM